MGRRGSNNSTIVAVVVAVGLGCESRQFIETDDGVQLAYEIHGSGADTVIVPLASYLAADWGERLATDRTIIFYDPRARGASTLPTDTTRLGLEYDVADLEAVRRHFNLYRPTVIGWSYYALVVAEFAARDPANAERIALVTPMPLRAHAPYTEELNGRAQRVDSALFQRFQNIEAEGWEERDPQVHCRAKLNFVTAPPMVADPTALGGMIAEPCQYSNEWPAHLEPRTQRIMGQLGDWDFRETAMAVRAKAMVMHGSFDHIPAAASEEWAAVLGNARVLVFAGSGRFLWLEALSSFYTSMEAFLSGHVPVGSTWLRRRVQGAGSRESGRPNR